MNTTSRESSSKTDERIDKLVDQISTLVEIVTKKVITPATVKAIEESCVICGDAHAYYNCNATDSNQSSVCAVTGTYNQVAPPNRASNQMAPPGGELILRDGDEHAYYNCNDDPRVPLIPGRSFLWTGRALIDVYGGELILRDGDEQLIFHVDSTSKIPQKHANESSNMINFINVTCEDSFEEILKLKKSNHPSRGSTTPLSDSRPSLASFETSDSLLEEFADELALLDSFPPGNEDVDFEADFREIELLFNHDPSTDFSPNITIDPNPERFINELALVCLPPLGDDDDDKGCDLPFCDNKMIFSNPLFGFNDDFTSSDGKSFLEEDVQEENFQIYSNPLFEFDDNYNSSDINPLFNEILENEDSDVSNFDEPVLLNTPLFDKDECFDPGDDIDEIDVFLAIDVPSDIMDAYNDSEGDALEILHNTTHNLFPEVFFDHEPQCFKDEPGLDKLKSMDKVFNLGIWEIIFSPTYVKLFFEDRHYFSFTYVIRIFLPYFTYPMDSFLPLSSGSKDTIFDPGISAFHFSSLEPVAFESQMEVCSSTCSIPMDN
ncbi:hypothetical protein Tco_1249894 [Tanacetum coccineum]